MGYDSESLAGMGNEPRKVLYMELAPSYDPLRDDIIRLHFVNAKRRRQKIEQGDTSPGMLLLSDSPALVKLTRDWKTLSQLLLVKGKAWEYEKEVRLTVGRVGWPRSLNVIHFRACHIYICHAGYRIHRAHRDGQCNGSSRHNHGAAR